jgi:hypothetical protein
VVVDIPAIARLAGRRVPGELVDTAHLRFQTGFLSPEEVLETIDRRCVQAVAAGRSFAERPAVVNGLERRFARQVAVGPTTLYLDRRDRCRPV